MDKRGLFYHLEVIIYLLQSNWKEKNDNERVTIVVCCNRDGSDKAPLWIIGKYKYVNPRCFKNVNIRILIVIIELTRKHGWLYHFFKKFVWLVSQENEW